MSFTVSFDIGENAALGSRSVIAITMTARAVLLDAFGAEIGDYRIATTLARGRAANASDG
jgi:hypothetical protein